MHAAEAWDRPGLALTLAPLGWLYAGGWRAYRALYDLGLKRPDEPHPRVIVVGGLVAGGAGKSPVVLHLASLLQEMGHGIVIGASGYGAPRAAAAALAPDGELDPAEWGDEPAMIRDRLPDVPLVIGRRRVLAAEIAHVSHAGAVLLMDDGFQHLPLKKHLSLVVDAHAPTNRRCLPAGPYREPRRSGRRRADAVLETGGGAGWRVAYSPLDITADQVLCALGHPAGFLEALGSPNGPVVLRPDHDTLTDPDLLTAFDPSKPIAVTEKDWVKLRRRPDAGDYRWAVARREARVEPAQEFRAWLHNNLREHP